MRLSLTRHPKSPRSAIRAIEAEVLHPALGRFAVRYRLLGEIDRIRLPAGKRGGRGDGLWRHSCFELFVKPHGGTAYVEYNFAPSGQWSIWRFSDYRTGREEFGEVESIRVRRTAEGLSLCAAIKEAPPFASRLGLCAVIEEEDGALSYWSLVHPPGEPDFHDDESSAIDFRVAVQ